MGRNHFAARQRVRTLNTLNLIHAHNLLNQAVSSGDNWKADVNGDGRINVLDLLVIRGKLGTSCQ